MVVAWGGSRPLPRSALAAVGGSPLRLSLARPPGGGPATPSPLAQRDNALECGFPLCWRTVCTRQPHRFSLSKAHAGARERKGKDAEAAPPPGRQADRPPASARPHDNHVPLTVWERIEPGDSENERCGFRSRRRARRDRRLTGVFGGQQTRLSASLPSPPTCHQHHRVGRGGKGMRQPPAGGLLTAAAAASCCRQRSPPAVLAVANRREPAWQPPPPPAEYGSTPRGGYGVQPQPEVAGGSSFVGQVQQRFERGRKRGGTSRGE